MAKKILIGLLIFVNVIILIAGIVSHYEANRELTQMEKIAEAIKKGYAESQASNDSEPEIIDTSKEPLGFGDYLIKEIENDNYFVIMTFFFLFEGLLLSIVYLLLYYVKYKKEFAATNGFRVFNTIGMAACLIACVYSIIGYFIPNVTKILPFISLIDADGEVIKDFALITIKSFLVALPLIAVYLVNAFMKTKSLFHTFFTTFIMATAAMFFGYLGIMVSIVIVIIIGMTMLAFFMTFILNDMKRGTSVGVRCPVCGKVEPYGKIHQCG
jgi:hypothetical protein